MLRASHIVELQDSATGRWHSESSSGQEDVHLETFQHLGAAGESPDSRIDGLEREILLQHRANFELWHEEDKARDPEATDPQVAHVKRSIDRLNQRRNDLMEKVDERFLELAGEQDGAAPLHSESPGLMIDRLSILALKIYHTAEEAARGSASEAHREKNRARVAVLHEQRRDLAGCLESLWAEVMAGKRRFKLYRQMKMYNDPELNPVVYSRRPG